MNTQKRAIYRKDDDELLGFISQGTAGWDAQTIFGYSIARVDTEDEAERIVRENGLACLTGVWQYMDEDDRAWHPCILKEVYEHKVVVLRTNEMGYQDPDDYKIVTIKNPSETNLIKS